ncbi:MULTISPECIES: hypothetical protein [unclassified Micromonospora]|uniref:hypothetical protein n=1 Tax=unclassified Micromonospora TaxID=2617518 RepID=UPI002FF4109E
MDLADCLERVLELRNAPLPRADATLSKDGGPGYLVLYLRTSGTFCEDRSQANEVWDRFSQDCLGLTEALGGVWGPAGSVDLSPVLDRAMRGETVSALADVLSNFVPSVSAWRFEDRTVCVAVGQWDAELPVVLVAAAGEL